MVCGFEEEPGNVEHAEHAQENESQVEGEPDLDAGQQTPAATELPITADSAGLLGLEEIEELGVQKLARREKLFHAFLVVALLGFGTYQSILYFGHKVVPLSDFPNIVRTGHETLVLRDSYKLQVRTSCGYTPSIAFASGGRPAP